MVPVLYCSMMSGDWSIDWLSLGKCDHHRHPPVVNRGAPLHIPTEAQGTSVLLLQWKCRVYSSIAALPRRVAGGCIVEIAVPYGTGTLSVPVQLYTPLPVWKILCLGRCLLPGRGECGGGGRWSAGESPHPRGSGAEVWGAAGSLPPPPPLHSQQAQYSSTSR